MTRFATVAATLLLATATVSAQGKTTEALLAELFRPVMPQPRWLDRDATRARARLQITSDLAAFDGHFPAMPILPGVTQLDWAIELARGCFALPERFMRVEALKFQRPIRPGHAVELDLQWQPEGGVLAFRYISDDGPHSSGRVYFGAGDA